MRVAVGMSGGVDSAVAAIILKDQGHDVIGISMALWDDPVACVPVTKHACYGPDEKDDIREAEEACRHLDIPFHVFDCSHEYRRTVLEYFKHEYRSARTPNPCIVCNHKIKFDALIREAKASGIPFDMFATGHYARTVRDRGSGRYLLMKGLDRRKDQSYFLYRLSQAQLSGAMFPLGDLSKEHVRSIARLHGLAVSEKEESQDFYCGDYRDLLGAENSGGDIVLAGGRVVGRHTGLWNYTPGQRRGLGIAYPEPLYVKRLDARTNSVIVGTKEEIPVASFAVTGCNWITADGPAASFRAMVKTRSSQEEMKGLVEPAEEDEVKVTMDAPCEAVSPGQSAVFYNGDVVIGGGIINRIFEP